MTPGESPRERTSDDPDRAMRASLIESVARGYFVILLVFGAVLAIPGVSPTPVESVVSVLTAALACVVVIALNRRGWVRTAGTIIPFMFVVAAVSTAAQYGGTTGTMAIGFMTPVLVAAMLLGRRALIPFAALSLGGALFVAWLESRGLAPSLVQHLLPAGALASIGAGLAVVILLLSLFIGRLERAMRQAEAAAEQSRKSEERLASMIRESPDGIVVVDDNGIILSINPAAARMGGFGEGEPVGASVFDATGSDATVRRAQFEKLLAKSPGGLVEIDTTDKQGNPIFVELNARRLEADDGSVRVQLVVRDVSERRRATQRQEALETQLREARRLESLGRLAGGVAHDVRNMLMVIIGNADLIHGDSDVSPDVRTLSAEILEAGQRAEGVARQLLAFARRQPSAPRAVDLVASVRALEPMLRRLTRENVRLDLVLANEPIYLRADPHQLDQVVLNLVANARDALPHGGLIRVEVRLAPDEAPAGTPTRWAEILVTDDGVGMSRETRDRVFEPFFTTKGQGEGTGLGMATVHGIVAQAGGEIRVESEVGTGTTFRVRLRTGSPPTPFSGGPAAVDPGATAAPRAATLLIVDDEPLVRTALARMLRAEGHRILEADSADTARVIAADPSRPFDLLITDMVMPGGSGRALADDLRRQRPDLPVLILSGYSEEITGEDLPEGMRFASKPIGSADLKALVDGLLQRGTKS